MDEAEGVENNISRHVRGVPLNCKEGLPCSQSPLLTIARCQSLDGRHNRILAAIEAGSLRSSHQQGWGSVGILLTCNVLILEGERRGEERRGEERRGEERRGEGRGEERRELGRGRGCVIFDLI
jgi:hypothetical protein